MASGQKREREEPAGFSIPKAGYAGMYRPDREYTQPKVYQQPQYQEPARRWGPGPACCAAPRCSSSMCAAAHAFRRPQTGTDFTKWTDDQIKVRGRSGGPGCAMLVRHRGRDA